MLDVADQAATPTDRLPYAPPLPPLQDKNDRGFTPLPTRHGKMVTVRTPKDPFTARHRIVLGEGTDTFTVDL